MTAVLLLAISTTAIGYATFGVAAAQAGTYAITANGPQVCALGTFIENVPGFTADCSSSGSVNIDAPATGSAYNDRQLWEIDSPSAALTITGAQFASIETNSINGTEAGYGGGSYWSGGGQPLNTGGEDYELGFGSAPDSSTAAFASQYFGLQLVCSDTGDCDGDGTEMGAQLVTSGFVSVDVQESATPYLVASGSGNLFYAMSGWVWNSPSDPWPASTSATDPSGVCSMSVIANGVAVSQVAFPPNTTTWQQCPSPSIDNAAVDTGAYVPDSGQLLLTVTATNAAAVETVSSSTINVDNVQPTVTVSPLNDANPGGWSVNHSVTLRVTPTVGPSGMSGLSCSDTVAGTTTPLTLTADSADAGSYDVTVDGNGSHAVACQVANNAVDPQGANNTGSAAETVDIDEQPPSLSFAPIDPSNPDQVVVQTGDDESAVAGGSIQIAPAGSNTYTSLPTSFTSNGQLVATIPDSTLAAGAYTVVAAATSQVGNTGTTSESVTLPLRTAITSAVSFAKVVGFVDRRVKERVLVGWHYAAKLNKKGKPVKVKVGGHYKTITVIKRAEKCTTRRVKIAKHKWKLKTTCVKPHVQYRTKLAIGHGKTAKVYGELTSGQGVPIAGQSVAVLTVPNNGGHQETQIATATTNANGGWSAKVPAGPSRTVEAVFAGADTLLPATGTARLTVPARIIIRATPMRLSWSSTVVISGRLKGGYIPRDGVAMRLLIRLPGRKTPYSPVPFRTTSKGTFKVKWSWGTGSGLATYPFSVATTSNESDYPFAAAASPRVNVTFGG